MPFGRLNRNSSEYPLRVCGKPEVVDRFKTMGIGQRNGRPVMLSEVAEVKDGIEEQRSLAFVNGVQAKGNLACAQRDYLVSRVTYEWAIGMLGEREPRTSTLKLQTSKKNWSRTP
jgi:Cu/Ag efflux pump CusA